MQTSRELYEMAVERHEAAEKQLAYQHDAYMQAVGALEAATDNLRRHEAKPGIPLYTQEAAKL